jgi:hypothetical protein
MARTSYPGLPGRTTIPGATASALLQLGSGRTVTPYLLAGVGTYRTDYSVYPGEWHFGVSGGGGLRLKAGRATFFTEARVHAIGDGSTPRLVPISFGMRF